MSNSDAGDVSHQCDSSKNDKPMICVSEIQTAVKHDSQDFNRSLLVLFLDLIILRGNVL